MSTSPESAASQPQTEAAQPLPSCDEALANAQAKIAELQDKLLRALADADNMRKRLQKEKQEAVMKKVLAVPSGAAPGSATSLAEASYYFRFYVASAMVHAGLIN